MSPQMYIVDGANKLRKVNRATVVCPGKAIKYLDGDIPNLRRVLETNKGWDAVLDLKYLNVLDLHGASYAFVSVRCTGQSDCVLIPVPAGNIRNQQGAWKAAAESAHFDEKSPEYNTSKAQRDRAVKNCTFTRHLEPSTISDLEVHSDSSIVFFSPPLSEPEWELDAEESDAEETKIAERAQSSGDEEEADPRQKHGRAVVIRQGRGAYQPHEDTIIGPVGKRIKCTFDEYVKLIGKGHRLMAERLTYKHATLCQGKDKEGIAGKCIYVSFLITDRPSANDKSYHHLHNMQKSNVVDHIARMREQAAADGVDSTLYPCLNWVAEDLVNGSQLAPGDMKPVKDALIISDKKAQQPLKRGRDASCPDPVHDSRVVRPRIDEGEDAGILTVHLGADYDLQPIRRPKSDVDGTYLFAIVRK